MKKRIIPKRKQSAKFELIIVHPSGGATTLTISIPGARFMASGGRFDGSNFVEYKLEDKQCLKKD